MFQFDYTLKQLKDKPILAFKGAIICDTDSERLTRYIVKDVANEIPILIEIGDKHKTVVPNCVGDYILNLRTGYLSVILEDEKISNPISNYHMNDYELRLIRKDFNIL